MKYLIKVSARASVSLLITLLIIVTVQAQTFPGAGFTIANNAGRVAASCSPITVSGIVGSRNVRSVSVNISHTKIGDLEFRLYPPSIAPPSVDPPSFTLVSPPDARNCNFSGTYRFIDTAPQSIDTATTTGCTNAANVAAGDYRTSDYGGGTANGANTSLTTDVGLLPAAQVNGTWNVCVYDFAAGNTGTVASTSIQFAVPTAAGATISGRVASGSGSGISGANVTITDTIGNSRTVKTSSFGYYSFEDLPVGQNYVLSVSAKRFQFDNPQRVINLSDSIAAVDFVAVPN